MIVAIIGPSHLDNETIAGCFPNIKQIDMVETMRALPEIDGVSTSLARKMVSRMSTSEDFRRLFLKLMETEYDNYVIYSNILFTDDTIRWIVNEGGLVMFVTRESLDDYPEEELEEIRKYFADDDAIEFEFNLRFQQMYDETIQTIDDEADVIPIGYCKMSDEDIDSDCLDDYIDLFSDDSLEIPDTVPAEVFIDTLNEHKEDDMTLEDTIREAMNSLGLSPDDDLELPKEEKSKKKPQPKKEQPKSVREVQKKQPAPKKKQVEPEPEEYDDDDFMNEPECEVTAEPDGVDDDSEEMSVFCKISGNKMVLLIPDGIEFESTNIGGIAFNQCVVKVPDIKNTKLQELVVISDKVEEERPKPAKNPAKKEQKQVSKPALIKSSAKPQKAIRSNPTASGEENIDDLVSEKKRLDVEIKEARSDGDQELVNELRKQRRAIRNKINKLK